ncbi:MAG: DUF1343 domain-containing protein [Bacteroidia bacterium]|nr:DUF1343 domain-containing protein [Bacteroidia bacterium]
MRRILSTLSTAKFSVSLFLLSLCVSCTATPEVNVNVEEGTRIVSPANTRIDYYLPLLANRNVALVANNTSRIGETHLLDTLLSLGVKVKKVFVPEHGFRGNADAGQKVDNSVDSKTGVPIVSLYGKHKKPTAEDMLGIDMVVYDLQDVGTRFYTYISTLHYVMEACAETNNRAKEQGGRAEVLVLDRPNPQGGIVDGPVRDEDCISFVGLDPLPILYGLTPAELACMINGEGWLAEGKRCMLRIVPMAEYSHNWQININCQPSPNLRTNHAIALYPSLCLFEGTNVSVGRGTDMPFEVIGSPYVKGANFSFVPAPSYGAADPLFKGDTCRGVDLREVNLNGFSLKYIMDMYSQIGDSLFWPKRSSFDILAGTKSLRAQLREGWSEDSIRASWQPKLSAFKSKRTKYLLYDREIIKDRAPISDWKSAMHSRWVDSVYNSLSLREKIGQMVWVTLDVNFTEKSIQKIEDNIKEWGIGGVLVLKASPSSCLQFVERVERLAKVPMLFAADAENGLGMKFIDVDKYPNFQQLGTRGDSTFVRMLGQRTAEQMLACGLNINFSPVVDVNTNPKNPIIGKRAFGDNVELVSMMGESFVRGLQGGGVCAVIKHFPGHGDTSKDSHLSLPVVAHDSLRLANVELAPFKHCINIGAMGVMSAHLVVPALDPTKRAASQSAPILKEVLRNKLGFEGLIVSDAVNMKGALIAAGNEVIEKATLAAGNDVAEFSQDVQRAILATEQAIQSGEIEMSQIEASVRRILAVKEWSFDAKRQRFGYPEAVANLPIVY